MNAIVTVNGESMDTADALRFAILYESDFLQNITDTMLIRQYAEQHQITNSDEELQVALDEIRYIKELESVEDTHQWLKSHNLTPMAMQNYIEAILLRNKVRGAIPDTEIEAYFVEHQSEYDSVELYSIRLNDKNMAEELYAQVVEEGEDFHVLAMEHSADEETKAIGGYVGILTRSEMIGEIEVEVFQAKPGEIVGPIQTEHGYNLFKVAEVHKATLEEQKEDIRFQLFQSLLGQLRADAKIMYPLLQAE